MIVQSKLKYFYRKLYRQYIVLKIKLLPKKHKSDPDCGCEECRSQRYKKK